MVQERAGNATEQSLAQRTVAARSHKQEAHVVPGGGASVWAPSWD